MSLSLSCGLCSISRHSGITPLVRYDKWCSGSRLSCVFASLALSFPLCFFSASSLRSPSLSSVSSRSLSRLSLSLSPFPYLARPLSLSLSLALSLSPSRALARSLALSSSLSLPLFSPQLLRSVFFKCFYQAPPEPLHARDNNSTTRSQLNCHT